jgi:hypothetical protein
MVMLLSKLKVKALLKALVIALPVAVDVDADFDPDIWRFWRSRPRSSIWFWV